MLLAPKLSFANFAKYGSLADQTLGKSVKFHVSQCLFVCDPFHEQRMGFNFKAMVMILESRRWQGEHTDVFKCQPRFWPCYVRKN